MIQAPDRKGLAALFTLYEGDFVDGKREGVGYLKDQVGQSEYTGEFKDDFPHGYGTVIWHDGAKFSGHLYYGRMKHGIFNLPDGGEYNGYFDLQTG